MINSELILRYEREMTELQRKWLRPVILPAVVAVALLEQLQLALQQPGNIGPSAQLAREFCDNVIAEYCPEGSALRQVIEARWKK